MEALFDKLVEQEGGQLVAELCLHLTLRVGQDVPEVAHVSFSRCWPSVIFLIE